MKMTSEHNNTKYYIGFVIIGIAVISFLAYLIDKESNRVMVDKVTGCPEVSKGALIVLVDRTEDYTEQGISELQSRVLKEIDRLNAYDRVSIFSVSEISKRNLKPLFDRCVPDLDPDPAIENKNQVNNKFKREFLGTMGIKGDDDYREGTILYALSKKYNDSDESPVAQVITDMTLDTDRFSSIENKKFLIFSDMLEHTDRFSIYKGCISQEDVVRRFKDSRVNMNVRPTFNGADIMVNLLPNTDASPDVIRCRAMLWNWFFSGGGANTVKWHDMPGI